MKHADAPESNKALAFILHLSNFNLRGIKKQEEALKKRIGFIDYALFASHTVPIVAGHCCFLTLQFQFQSVGSLKYIGTCEILK